MKFKNFSSKTENKFSELKLTEDLAYLLGALRDGSLSKPSKNKYEVTLAADFHKSWITGIVIPKAKKVFALKNEKLKLYALRTHKSKRNLYRLKVYSKNLHKKLNQFYPTGSQKIWKTPEIIKKSEFSIIREYIRGFYDAEGGCRDVLKYKKGETKTINCEAIIRCVHKGENEPLIFIKNILENLGIKVHLRRDNTGLMITGKKNLLRFYEKFNPLHPKKSKMLRELLLYYGVLPSAEA